MLFARLAEYLSPSSPPLTTEDSHPTLPIAIQNDALTNEKQNANRVSASEEEKTQPLLHAGLAGGLGGVTGDMMMHSLDTVKTRQQGDPYRPPKYHSLGNTYYTIWRQEGAVRGLYGGVLPAFVGSFGGTFVFFGAYEWSKKVLLDRGINPTSSYLGAGLIADLAASPLYVPTEVLKTRLQLQGRYNNPNFKSGYNYRSTIHAITTIVRHEGISALFHGYRATLGRDLPFSALQFAFYEKERQAAIWWYESRSLSLPVEILVGATAGGAAGVLTCPFDVVKTRMQTQIHSTSSSSSNVSTMPASVKSISPATATATVKGHSQQLRHVSTTGPPTSLRKLGASATLDTASVFTGLRIIYQTEGVTGWFRGVGPRAVWTSIQSGCMFVLYQVLLGKLEDYPIVRD